jgi:hypothetical protein
MLTDMQVERIYLGLMLDDYVVETCGKGPNGNGNGNGHKGDSHHASSDMSELTHEDLERIILGFPL